MIVDTGCPRTLCGEDWLMDYLKENNLKKGDLEIAKCCQYFRFGPGQVYHSGEEINLPVAFVRKESDVLNNELFYTKIKVFVVKEAKVPILCGRNTLKVWGAVLDIKNSVLKMEFKGKKSF